MLSPRALVAALGVSLLLVSGDGALAALVEGAEGAISVNYGEGFVAGAARSEVLPGGQIMVAPGQAAVITYSDGCRARVGSGRVWTIEQNSPCPPGQSEIDYTRIAPDPEPLNIGQVQDPTLAPPGGGFPDGYGLALGVGAGVAALAVGIGLASKSSKASSP
jgi:hypothetical protein